MNPAITFLQGNNLTPLDSFFVFIYLFIYFKNTEKFYKFFIHLDR